MTKEFKLSEKIVDTIGTPHKGKIYVEDVKTFIKKLKEKRNNGDFVHIRDIEKLAGDEFK